VRVARSPSAVAECPIDARSEPGAERACCWMHLIMKPIAAPIIGGLVNSTIHVLIITPVFYLMKTRALRRGTFRASGMHL
jgi:Cu/Ag efflux pump CusA